jgi:hypothetical protein
VLPILILVAVPKALAPVIFDWNKFTVPELEELIVGEAPFMFTAVALLNVIVGFAIVNVPVLAPKFIAVAAPKAFTVVRLVLNKVNVPVEVPATVGLAPFILNVVALLNVTVAFAIVAVPVAAPMVNVVAAPANEMLVDVVLNNVNVATPLTTVGELSVVVPPGVAPILTLVVDDAAPPVPMFTVLVVAAAVALVIKFNVTAVVGVPPIAKVVAAPKAFTVTRLVLNNVNVPVELLAKVGLAPFILKVVALLKVTVALAIVVVPVLAPILRVVAAPAKETLVETVLNKVNVAGPSIVVKP